MRFRVTGRRGRIVHEDVDEAGLRNWQRSLDALCRTGALTRSERFRITRLQNGEVVESQNWRPSSTPSQLAWRSQGSREGEAVTAGLMDRTF